MNKARVWIALGLSLALVALWSWRAKVQAARESDLRVFLSYMDGPLGDYMLSVTRKGPEGRRYASASVANLRVLAAEAPEGYSKRQLQALLPFHEKASTAGVIDVLESVRYETQDTWKWPRSRALELNALIYSLKETEETFSK